MNIEITGRHVKVKPAIEAYTREKAERIAKFVKSESARLEVILDHQADHFAVEMIVHGGRGPVIVASVHHPEPNAAVDLAIDKIEHRLRQEKERRKDHRGESMAGEKTLGGRTPRKKR